MKKILLLFCLSLIIGLQYSFAQTDSKTDKEKFKQMIIIGFHLPVPLSIHQNYIKMVILFI